jgi:RsiW-degrading membrane proteinase PrsW (M82 family)
VFFMLPMLSVFAIYILAAILPAAFLMRYIYRKDKVEKEPPRLLFSLIVWGVIAALVSIALEYLGIRILSSLVDRNNPSYILIFAFLVVAAVEEGTKFFFLIQRTWRDPNFNYRFDGIVYAVFISLGFAAFENIRYVMGYGLTTALPRAVLAIPGHMGFAVFMGLFYGRAKVFSSRGSRKAKNVNLFAGYISAVALHGFYDACAMIGTVMATMVFLAFVIIMYVVVIRMVRRQSALDKPI